MKGKLRHIFLQTLNRLERHPAWIKRSSLFGFLLQDYSGFAQDFYSGFAQGFYSGFAQDFYSGFAQGFSGQSCFG